MFCVAVVGVIALTVGAVVSVDAAETTTVAVDPVPIFPAASVQVTYTEYDPAADTDVIIDAVPEASAILFADPFTYATQLVTPTASLYVVLNVVETPAIAVNGETDPTVGAVVSVDAEETMIDVAVPVPIFPDVSVHRAYTESVPAADGAKE